MLSYIAQSVNRSFDFLENGDDSRFFHVFERDRKATRALADNKLLVARIENTTLDLPCLVGPLKDESHGAANVPAVLPRITQGTVKTRRGHHQLVDSCQRTCLLYRGADASAQFREQVCGDAFLRVHKHLEDLPACKRTE